MKNILSAIGNDAQAGGRYLVLGFVVLITVAIIVVLLPFHLLRAAFGHRF